MKLSIIIPTLNEAAYLACTVTSVRGRAVLGQPHEVLVADCGSRDGTVQIARQLGVSLLCDEFLVEELNAIEAPPELQVGYLASARCIIRAAIREPPA